LSRRKLRARLRQRDGQIGFGGVGNNTDEVVGPTGMAVDPATGGVYAVDAGNNRAEVFERWSGCGLPEALVRRLRGARRERQGRAAEPTAVMVDS